jgi:hypothetical protein
MGRVHDFGGPDRQRLRRRRAHGVGAADIAGQPRHLQVMGVPPPRVRPPLLADQQRRRRPTLVLVLHGAKSGARAVPAGFFGGCASHSRRSSL